MRGQVGHIQRLGPYVRRTYWRYAQHIELAEVVQEGHPVEVEQDDSEGCRSCIAMRQLLLS